jgi:hypothetical protein
MHHRQLQGFSAVCMAHKSGANVSNRYLISGELPFVSG